MNKLAIILLFLPLAALAEVTTQSYSVTYTCTGSTGPYGFTFPVSAASSLTVTQAGVLLSAGSYTIVPVNNSYANGGSVTLNSACSSGTLVLARVTPLTQATVFTDNMPIPMKTIERSFDKLTEVAQEQGGNIGALATWNCAPGMATAGMAAFVPQCVDIVPNGTVTDIIHSNNVFTGTNNFTSAGVFTDTQMNNPFVFLLNGIDPKVETHDNSDSVWNTSGIVGGVAIPVGSTVGRASGVVGLLNNSSTVTNAVAGLFQTRALANNTTNWGANVIATDAVGLTTGVSLLGVEVGTGPQNAISAYSGAFGVTAAIGGTASAWADNTAIGGSAGFTSSRNSTTRWWDYGFKSNDNTAVSGALLSGAQGCDGTGASTCNSQGIVFASYLAGVAKSAKITTTSSGAISMSPQSGTPVSVNSDLTSTGIVTGTRLISNVAIGTAPLTVTSTTPVANLTASVTSYNHSGTQQVGEHFISDTCVLGTSCSVTLTGAAVFTSNATYDCWARDATTAANVVTVAISSGSAVAFTGTGTDTINYFCKGH